MKIRDAFNKSKIIDIDYVWLFFCKSCKKEIENIDEEYSFCGTIEEFEEKYKKPENYQDLLDFDYDITEVGQNHYAYYENDFENCICDKCKSADF